jgi:hypothetical protein
MAGHNIKLGEGMKTGTKTDVRVRMLIDTTSTFHNNPDGVKRGDIVALPEADALRYEYFQYCEPISAADETPSMRKERVDRTTAAVQRYMADKLADVERSRLAARRTIDAGTGLPMQPCRR